jgi:WD40 repeat protein
VSWAIRGGGNVAVFDAKNPTRLRLDLPVITGHTGPVCDVKFSPFVSNLLATASDDATVRIWQFPQEGLSENFSTEKQKFTGHSKKVGLLSFNPSVAEIIASAGFDNSLNVWNICNGESYSKINFNDGIYSMDWNSNGSLLGVTTKEKLVHIVDPRANKIEMSAKGHESGKIQKISFLTGDYLMSCGFNRSNERQIRLYDARKFDDSVQKVTVDTQSGIMTPFFDADVGLIYLPGRGEGNIKYFDFSNSTVKFASEYRGGTIQKGMAMFPKRVVSYNRCEINRFAKMTNNTIEYLSFYVPKRNEGYDSSIYPDCISGEPSLKVEEWLKGENKEPIRKNITSIQNLGGVANEMHFEKKPEVVHEEIKISAEEKEVYLFYMNFNIYLD